MSSFSDTLKYINMALDPNAMIDFLEERKKENERLTTSPSQPEDPDYDISVAGSFERVGGYIRNAMRQE